mgnify:CR=1 FL=1
MIINTKNILARCWSEVKKILKIYLWSFLGFYVPILVTMNILVSLKSRGPFVWMSVLQYINYSLFLMIYPFIFAPFAVVVLYLLSFLDKRVSNGWFTFGVGVYCLMIGKMNQTRSLWFIVSVELASLIIVLLVMNFRKIVSKIFR